MTFLLNRITNVLDSYPKILKFHSREVKDLQNPEIPLEGGKGPTKTTSIFARRQRCTYKSNKEYTFSEIIVEECGLPKMHKNIFSSLMKTIFNLSGF